MINIRPVSDLRNKYPEIENLTVKEDEVVYLTKNGYGSMVVMSLERYARMLGENEVEQAMEEKYKNIDIEKIEDEMDKEMADKNVKYLTHEEVFGELRRKLNEK